MSLSFTQLLWAILIIGLLVFVAYWWGKRSAAPVPARETVPPPQPAPRVPSAAPPPANAGSAHHPGTRIAPPAATTKTAAPAREERAEPEAPRPLPRTPGAIPPPAAAGGAARTASPQTTSAKRPVASASSSSIETRRASPETRSSLSAVKSWGYQLQNLDIARAAASPFDLLVIDYAKDGSDDTALKPADLARLQKKPDGSRRLVIAYLSIGEAEGYRYYWDDTWKRTKPAWMLGENPEWKENYAVCFWEPEWQRLMCGGPDAYLDKIMAAGFDGIYLDKCDVFEDMRQHFRKAAGSRPDIERDMVAFVERLSRYAKSKDPGFIVVMQNAEPLIEYKALLAAIDGVAKEELVYGVDAPEKLNSREDFEWSHDMLAKAQAAGKQILVVEYLDNAAKIKQADELVTQAGFVLFISPKDRELKKLNYQTFEA